jgi:probable F420-dependent oxidoreductase
MRFGITSFLTDQSIAPDELAREAEERGFDSLFVPEHTHIPSARTTPAPMGGELPAFYSRLLDPFVSLTTAAAATTRLRVGTGICLVAQHDPIVLAKQVASIDHVSGGRFTFGIGFGWNVEELEDHGVAYGERRDVVRERMLAMQALWASDEASFDGAHVRFGPAWSWPKPAQRPRPPVLIGGAGGPKLFAHVIEYADGWIPIGGRGLTAMLPELRALAERNGRDPDTLRVVPFGSLPDAGKLEHFAQLGIDEVVLGTPSGPRDVILPVLDDYARVIESFTAKT